MNVQKGLGGLLPLCHGSSTATRVVCIPLRQISRPTETATRGFTSAARSTHFNSLLPVRATCHKQLLAGQWTGRAAFSSNPPSRSAEGETQKDVGEAKEGTQGTSPTGGKAAYPERLIIFHAGTGKTTFLACLKVTTLFVFGFFDMVMAPAYLAASEPLLKTAGVALCGLIPALYVAWATAPFVASIHMHLPPYARYSRTILERFARTAPPNTRLDVTTMSLIGKPRVSSLMLSDLRPATAAAAAGPEKVVGGKVVGGGKKVGWGSSMGLRTRLGMVNYLRDTSIVDQKRKWWRFRAVGGFNIQEQPDVRQRDRNLRTAWVWGVVREGIERKGKGLSVKGQGQGQEQGKL